MRSSGIKNAETMICVHRVVDGWKKREDGLVMQ